jgi:predicted RNA-binding Zn-ribbon protein involved in translation (DUF1610 family)
MKYVGNDGKEYDSYMDNESILDKLVGREVMCCMTQEVEFMLNQALENPTDNNPFTEDDYNQLYEKTCSECGSTYGFSEYTASELDDSDILINTDDDGKTVYVCPVCGLEYTTIQEAKDCCGNETVYKCDSCGHIYNEDDYNNLDEEPQEVYEWWAVTPWFGDKLKENGEIVIESYCKSYWGRCATGQAVSLDEVIGRIAFDMKILKGQEHDWSEN